MRLEVKQVRKIFDNTEALTDVTFTVGNREFVSVIGPSGAGKTTLFRIFNGAISADGGQIFMDGQNFLSGNRKKKHQLQKKIATIYQDFCLVEQSTCIQNVLNACLPDMSTISAALGLFGKARRAEAAELLDKVGLKDKLYEPVKNLSGGQKQRVAIARALMRKPDLLLADEPVASLDPATGRQIAALLKELQKTEGLTVLMNSHNLALSMEYSDKLVGLHNGAVVFEGTPERITKDTLEQIYGASLNSEREDSADENRQDGGQ